MLEPLVLPMATAPPSGDLRPSGTTGTAEAGQAPFPDVLAAAAAEPEPEAAPTSPAGDLAALAALTALMAQFVNLTPAAVAETPAATEGQAEPQPATATVSPSAAATVALPAAAADAVQPLEITGDGAKPAETSQPGFTALLSRAVNQADVAVVSPEAQQAQLAAEAAPAGRSIRMAKAMPAAEVLAPATSVDGAPDTVAAMPAPTLAAIPFEPARLAEAQSPTTLSRPEIVLPQVMRGVESLVRSGATSMHLQLYPEALGRVDVQVTTGAEGLRVTLTADSAAAGGLLQQHLADLRHSLTESGLNIQALSVGIGQGQTGQPAFAWQRPPHPAGFGPATGSPETDPAEVTAIPAPAGAGSRVDYRI